MYNVRIYTSTRCKYCMMLKNYLSSQNIKYQEFNVDGQPNMIQYLMGKTGQMGLPQTEINGQWILGYNPQGNMELILETKL